MKIFLVFQCSAVCRMQCSIVQCSVQNAVQHSAVQCVECSAAQCSAVCRMQCSTHRAGGLTLPRWLNRGSVALHHTAYYIFNRFVVNRAVLQKTFRIYSLINLFIDSVIHHFLPDLHFFYKVLELVDGGFACCTLSCIVLKAVISCIALLIIH